MITDQDIVSTFSSIKSLYFDNYIITILCIFMLFMISAYVWIHYGDMDVDFTIGKAFVFFIVSLIPVVNVIVLIFYFLFSISTFLEKISKIKVFKVRNKKAA